MFYKERGYKAFRDNVRLNIQNKQLLEIADKAYELYYWTKDPNKIMEGLKKEFGDILDDYEVLFYQEMIIVKDKYPLDSYESEAVKIVNVDFSSILWQVVRAMARIRYEEKKERCRVEVDTNYFRAIDLLEWLRENLEQVQDWTPGEDIIEVRVNEEAREMEVVVNDSRMKIKLY